MVLSAGMASIRRVLGRGKVVADLDQLSPISPMQCKKDSVVTIERIDKVKNKRTDEASSKLKQFLHQISLEQNSSSGLSTKKRKNVSPNRSKSMYARQNMETGDVAGLSREQSLTPESKSQVLTDVNKRPRRNIRSIQRSKSMCERSSSSAIARLSTKNNKPGSEAVEVGPESLSERISSKSIKVIAGNCNDKTVVQANSSVSPPESSTYSSTTGTPRSRKSPIYLLKGRKSRGSSRYAQRGEQVYIVPLSGFDQGVDNHHGDDVAFSGKNVTSLGNATISNLKTLRRRSESLTDPWEKVNQSSMERRRTNSLPESHGVKKSTEVMRQCKKKMHTPDYNNGDTNQEVALHSMRCPTDALVFSRTIKSPPVRRRADRKTTLSVGSYDLASQYSDEYKTAVNKKRVRICPFTATVQTYGVQIYDRTVPVDRESLWGRMDIYTELMDYKINGMDVHPSSRDNMNFHLNSVSGRQKTILINLLAGLR
ncbi:hypothetical protein SARC_10269 [Sphaeroforma arctica JP610]|uniref:Uncharacterized protein n=1 Tax=Sphaeroforma arctica JP610 TaxID=667725 RepID=A0A0L0FKG3_9EUKA|nr:hypothetical protein SARC_10269 [Sphaeroforma arctica JP610]KNC77267.1 hypothetical protein SARC_10269 [Sphaeroforma arctica JP610]|eukprot:XP_014151169.1 hypothetical protein SARC_10269 [Sphaeroforma arctica JP610]